MVLRTRAPAKINLTLHVIRRRSDGFHDLESLVAFAGVADILELDPERPLTLAIDGPTARAAGHVDDNLVLRAARALKDRVPGLRTGAFRLVKRLPVGAGIGGGSSDAAGALRLLAGLNGLRHDDERVHEAARATGSDVPVCVHPRSRMMRGTGDRLGDPYVARPFFAVLVNPGLHLETGAVFRRMGLRPGDDLAAGEHPLVHDRLDHESFLEAIGQGRNDMEFAAALLAPVIAEVLAAIRATPGCRIARMSGSGSTCFGLYGERGPARRAMAAILARHPDWWVKATALR
ncbi:MAG TPA: 4-(cytidine 5'-diphospho)-2-C-methyl-D-erythritol kinase [Lichenihabitans sp.]|jgi:4-diphosphocytidyl-2-C-methyl-D-erythritol kinase|nr:4-(cytidine 5'-diphospho)-2-C-methyl-D-erythritol kinase [Lichenihabitans sp.]